MSRDVGLWTSWDPNGQKYGEGTYRNGELISRKEWDKDGNQTYPKT